MSKTIKPIAHLVWLQGLRAADDVEDYFEVARIESKCVDGSDPFPVYGADAIAAKDTEIARLREALSAAAYQLEFVHDDAFKQASGHGLVTTDGRAFSCFQINKCSEAAISARICLAAIGHSEEE